MNKPFSSISLRLIALLLQELSVYEERKLPPRVELARKLGVSNTAINSSLTELEMSGFLERINSKIEKIVPVDEHEEEHQKLLESSEKEKDKNRKSRNFSDYFRINYTFNKTEEEIKMKSYEAIKNYLGPNFTNKEIEELFESLIDSGKIEEIIKKRNSQ